MNYSSNQNDLVPTMKIVLMTIIFSTIRKRATTTILDDLGVRISLEFHAVFIFY